jgi:hypothetical protein
VNQFGDAYKKLEALGDRERDRFDQMDDDLMAVVAEPAKGVCDGDHPEPNCGAKDCWHGDPPQAAQSAPADLLWMRIAAFRKDLEASDLHGHYQLFMKHFGDDLASAPAGWEEREEAAFNEGVEAAAAFIDTVDIFCSNWSNAKSIRSLKRTAPKPADVLKEGE